MKSEMTKSQCIAAGPRLGTLRVYRFAEQCNLRPKSDGWGTRFGQEPAEWPAVKVIGLL